MEIYLTIKSSKGYYIKGKTRTAWQNGYIYRVMPQGPVVHRVDVNTQTIHLH